MIANSNLVFGAYQKSGQNVYDIRGQCEGGNLCYPAIEWVAEYLNKADVQDALGVEVSKYDSCNFDINRNFLFQGDWMKPFHRVVPGILSEIPVLVYAGDADFICNCMLSPMPFKLSKADMCRAWKPSLD